MRRLLASACVLAATGGPAAAQKDYKVAITSAPEGAELRIDSREGEPVGQTPWQGSLTEGSHMLIFSLDDHHELVEEIVVQAERRRQTFEFTLQAIQYGRVEVTAGTDGSEGARVLVDGEPKGKVPASLRLEVGPHQIEVLQVGFRRFERWIEVAGGTPVEVIAALQPAEGGPPAVRAGAVPARTDPLVVAGAGFEVGWRRFRYVEPMTASARPFDAQGVPLLRVDLEVRPLAGRAGALGAGLGIGIEAAFGFPPAAAAPSGDPIDTSWTELAAELRYRHLIDGVFEVGAGAAFARTAFGFADAGALADEVPDADYRHLRLSASAGLRTGRLSARAGAAYMSPLSLGPLATRFQAASAGGLAAAATLGFRVRPRLEGSMAFAWRQWSWDFTSEPGDSIVASGGTDRYLGVLLGAVYLY